MSKIPQGEWRAIATRHPQGESRGAIPATTVGGQPLALALNHRRVEKSGPEFAAHMEPAQSGRGPVSAPQKQLGKRHGAGRAAALTAELDPELQAYAEAAIEAFRASFDEALVQRSAATRERLRRAASDLMRAAARTTIVLDRLDASAKSAHIKPADWPRHPSAQLHA
jgi:hypothetical protein